MKCLHCRAAQITRPRGLCWTCYYKPGVRDRYAPISKFGQRGIGNFYGPAARPPRPTAALPGSREKVAVLIERARLKQDLWHPDDSEFDFGRLTDELQLAG